MSATAAPFGLRPVGNLGGTYNSSFRQYPILSTESTRICFGDVVKLTDAGTTTTIQKDTGTATLTPIGVFLGCAYTDPSTGQFTPNQYYPASTAADDIVAYVATDPFILMQMQSDESLGQDDLGKNCAVVQTAGSTAIGTSRNAVDGSTANTTATLPLKVVDFVDGPDSEVGDSYTDVLVMFNVGHQLLNTTGIG